LGLFFRVSRNQVAPIEAAAEKQKTIPLPPVFGAIAFVGRIALMILGNKSLEPFAQ
jgi:hypothetical protein